MDPDDIEYKRSVRNMSIVLAAIALVIVAALALSPYAFPPSNTFQESVSYSSAFGFAVHLQINATSLSAGDGILVSGWLNSSSGSLDNVTAVDSWGVGPSGLWTSACATGWPVGVGVMRGHYTQDNFSLGTLLPLAATEGSCQPQPASPGFFIFYPHSSRALIVLGGVPQYWVLQTNHYFGAAQLPPGVYTAVLADEWGDVVATNFVVT
ncbi:MAG: hypothetical protein JRM80_09470 [Nitrososphaerota archaeon]|nr:hypothetical protein [Nitrososphaerota archaeon]